MTTSKSLLIAASITLGLALLSILGFSGVRAQEATATEATTTTAEEQPKTTIQERLTKRKAALETQLTTAQQNRLKGRCRATQAKLGTTNDRALEVKTNRLRAYANLDKRLNSLVTKVGDKADTTDLKAQIIVLAQKVDVVEQALTDYRQAVSDLIEIDCVADPEGFKASLEEARALQESLKVASLDVHNYIKDTIKPTLKILRETLAKAEGTQD